jgi:DNA-binding SARP family transcriptional activator
VSTVSRGSGTTIIYAQHTVLEEPPVNARERAGLQTIGQPRLQVASTVTMVCRSGQPCELKGNAAVVLAWVAMEGHADRRRLSAALWPDSDAGQARSNLRVLTHRINQRFGGELLLGHEHLQLDATQAWVDLHDVDALLAALETGGAARCELLGEAGVGTDAGEALQTWLAEARQRQKQAQLSKLEQALNQALASNETARAAALARACSQLDPLSEQRHRRLMEVLARAGDRAAALSAYEACKSMLRQHLGVLPCLETRAVQLRILQEQALGPVQGPQDGAEAEGLAALGGAARYPLVERDAVLEAARSALAQGLHVVVQGEPGLGKTRLLRHLAAGAGDTVEPVAIRSALKHEPYAAIAQLLQEVQPRRAPVIGMPEQIELARLAPLAFAGVKPSEAALSAPRLHAALRHWLARLGEAGLRVLVVDDVQYADAASQAALASLLDAAPASAARGPALLLTNRSGETESVLEEAVTDAQTQHRARRLELQRLSPAGVQTLLTSMAAARHAPDTASLARQLHKRTGGNPLFVIELARQVLDRGEAADTASVQALLGASLSRCGAAAQQLAAVAAVAADDFTVELAAAVTGQTALGLMPAWRELQQRGLFAGQGLAHDLVSDAVLAGLPQAILQQLHREVGCVLEGQGVQGMAVLRHWVAADDADRALPHAVHHLYAASAAGLPTMPQELTMLGLLERASAPVLNAHLWLTGELDNSLGEALPAETWHRVRALRRRVESGPDAASAAAWIAYETARDRWLIDASPKAAFEVLLPAAAQMPERGIARAFVELELALLAVELTGAPQLHLQKARQALAGLPDQPCVNRVRMEIDDLVGIFVDAVEGMRTLVNRWRAGRRRGDLATMADACMRMGFLQGVVGNSAYSMTHYRRAARLHASDDQGTEHYPTPFIIGKAALNAGHYALAEQLLTAGDDRVARQQRPVQLATLYLRMGNRQQAAEQVALTSPEALREHFSAQITFVHACAELDRLEGRDPVPALQRQWDQARALGLSGINLELLSWEIVRRDGPAAARLPHAQALLARLRDNGIVGAKLAKALLEIAEVHAELGLPLWESLASEAARLFRRGCTNATLYLPDGLLRCARLLRHRDEREADALVHVAQRWVRQARLHLPRHAEEAFSHHVAVNRLLLGTDRQALYTAPLH